MLLDHKSQQVTKTRPSLACMSIAAYSGGYCRSYNDLPIIDMVFEFIQV